MTNYYKPTVSIWAFPLKAKLTLKCCRTLQTKSFRTLQTNTCGWKAQQRCLGGDISGMTSSCSANPDHHLCVCSTRDRAGQGCDPTTKSCSAGATGGWRGREGTEVPAEPGVQCQGEAQAWMAPLSLTPVVPCPSPGTSCCRKHHSII